MKLVMIFTLLAGAAQAQVFVPVVNPAQVDACFTQALRNDTDASCIGAASGVCMEQPYGYTTQAISQCTDAETVVWDGFLNREYKARMAQITPDQKTALRAAQRAWIAFRDADCQLQYQMFIDGSMRSNIYTGCMLDKTAQRALVLRDLGGM
ncbi:lysozyme inhibitor LprI family protein [Pseudorhodobacter sp.]|uniref:lysozyme inhibitor LprI family protein n=1 Tax=Pseudorhodobacter sp. TaxID=1934400 RepID=UPI002AFE1D7A|nr:lysozyme inhibitor LprI family protein [Pseudorhodobacter sp.]